MSRTYIKYGMEDLMRTLLQVHIERDLGGGEWHFKDLVIKADQKEETLELSYASKTQIAPNLS